MKKLSEPIKVCIIDDHSVVRMGFKYMLSFANDMEFVGEAADGTNAAAFVRECAADVVLLDVRMPWTDGHSALAEIIRDNPDARVLMLTTSDAEEDIYRAISAGARGYILKETPPQQLLDAIRKVAEGELCLSEELKKIYAQRAAERGLSEREREVLNYVANGLSNEEIAKILNVSFNTIKAHVRNILMTLGVSDRAEAVAQGMRRGIIG